MRIRRIDANGDMRFGHAQSDYWFNAPEGVGLLVMDRLMLFQGEWFTDTSDGTAWATEVLGERTRATRDLVIRDRVQTTAGVNAIDQYGSAFDPNTRGFAVAMTLDTVYGAVTLRAPQLPGVVPPLAPPAAAAAAFQATGLGVAGGTPLSMTPADLTASTEPNVTDFSIQRMATGSY